MDGRFVSRRGAPENVMEQIRADWAREDSRVPAGRPVARSGTLNEVLGAVALGAGGGGAVVLGVLWPVASAVVWGVVLLAVVLFLVRARRAAR